MAKISDIHIREWIKSNTRFDARGDGDCLYLRYRISDKKPIWFFRYKVANIEQKITLGNYPETSLSKARKESAILRAEIQKGNSPALEKREAKRKRAAMVIAEQSAQTVNQLVDEYFKKHVDGKLKTAKAIRQKINNYLIPAIGALKIDAVEPMHIANMLESIVNANAPTTANDVLTYSKQIFNYAIKRHIIKHNPANAFDSKDAGGKEGARTRYLSQGELIKLFAAMRESNRFTDHHYKITKLLLLLGCRKGELFSAKRNAFDLNAKLWRMSLDNKTNAAIDIPLTESALEIIKALLSVNLFGSDYLIPAQGVRSSKVGHIGVDYLNKPIKNLVHPLMNDVEPFHIHDFRGTLKTHLGKMGVNRFVSERCLNHKIEGMEGVYDRGDYFKERRAALELWAAFLESCENGNEWNVTPLRKSNVSG